MQRLKTRPQFQAALSGGIVSRTAHFALHRLMLEAAPIAAAEGASSVATIVSASAHTKPLFPAHDVWMGAMAPKRWARRAVTRNAIKRQIYQLSASLAPQLQQAAHVVRLRATFDRKQFISATSDHLKAAVRDELNMLFERANRSLHMPSAALNTPARTQHTCL